MLDKISIKAIINLFLIIALLLVLNKIRKKLKQDTNKGRVTNTDKIPTKDGTKTKNAITSAKAEQIARVSLNAMNKFGSDNSRVIVASLNELTGADLKEVYKQFGMIPYLAWGYSKFGKSLDLFGWYRAEYSGSQLKALKQVWDKSGLSFK